MHWGPSTETGMLVGMAALLLFGCAEPEERLKRAAREGSLDSARVVLEQDGDQLTATAKSQAFCIACSMGKGPPHDIVKLLLEHEAAADFSCGSDNASALHEAALLGKLSLVQLLLSQGASPTRTTSSGDTPLHNAASRKHLEVLRALLAKGAPPDRQNRSGKTPLMVAIDRSWPEGVKALLAAGAKRDLDAGKGRTALTLALKKGDTPMLDVLLPPAKELLEMGPDVWMAALQGGALYRLRDHVAKADPKLAHYSPKVPRGKARTPADNSPLMIAAAFGRPSRVAELIGMGLRVNGINSDGWRPLMFAAAAGRKESVRLLLKAGANPTRKCSRRKDAVDHAKVGRRMARIREEPAAVLARYDAIIKRIEKAKAAELRKVAEERRRRGARERAAAYAASAAAAAAGRSSTTYRPTNYRSSSYRSTSVRRGSLGSSRYSSGGFRSGK